jgi:hypothetical protein
MHRLPIVVEAADHDRRNTPAAQLGTEFRNLTLDVGNKLGELDHTIPVAVTMMQSIQDGEGEDAVPLISFISGFARGGGRQTRSPRGAGR